MPDTYTAHPLRGQVALRLGSPGPLRLLEVRDAWLLARDLLDAIREVQGDTSSDRVARALAAMAGEKATT